MTTFTFDIPPDLYQPTPANEAEEGTPHLLRRWHIEERRREEEEEAVRLAALPRERLITLKMPTDMIGRLDHVAKDAGTNRSQLIRQIASYFLNYVGTNGVAFRGSLLGFRHHPLETRDDE